MTTDLFDPTIPIAHDFTDREQAMAKAGYAAYEHAYGRRVWQYLRPHERFRWLLTAYTLDTWPDRTPEQLRATYMTCVTATAWDDLIPATRLGWTRLRAAMLEARSGEIAA